jgi:hypothetical protein
MTDDRIELAGPRNEGDETYFSREDLYRYLHAESRVRATVQAVGLNERHRRILSLEDELARRQAQQRMAAAEVEHAVLSKERDDAIASLNSIRSAIGERYGIDFERCLFDDTTGRITKAT